MVGSPSLVHYLAAISLRDFSVTSAERGTSTNPFKIRVTNHGQSKSIKYIQISPTMNSHLTNHDVILSISKFRLSQSQMYFQNVQSTFCIREVNLSRCHVYRVASYSSCILPEPLGRNDQGVGALHQEPANGVKMIQNA